MAHLKIAVGLLCSGLFWLLIFYLFTRLFRQKKKTEKPRDVAFMLPDRENTFVRSRLLTALNPEFCLTEEKEERLAVEFTQALKLLEKIWIAPLSPAEKIETGQLRNELQAFEKKQTFSVEEVRAINEKFARVLKLSAKYAV